MFLCISINCAVTNVQIIHDVLCTNDPPYHYRFWLWNCVLTHDQLGLFPITPPWFPTRIESSDYPHEPKVQKDRTTQESWRDWKQKMKEVRDRVTEQLRQKCVFCFCVFVPEQESKQVQETLITNREGENSRVILKQTDKWDFPSSNLLSFLCQLGLHDLKGRNILGVKYTPAKQYERGQWGQ